jgi:hypothetical protein
MAVISVVTCSQHFSHEQILEIELTCTVFPISSETFVAFTLK